MKQPSDSNILVNTSTSQKDPANISRSDQEIQKHSMSRRSSLSSRLSQLQDKEEEIKKKLADFDKRFGKRPPNINNSPALNTNSPEAHSGFEFSEIPKITESTFEKDRVYTDECDLDSDGAVDLKQNFAQKQNFSQKQNNMCKQTNGPVYLAGATNLKSKNLRADRLDEVFEKVNEANRDFRNRDTGTGTGKTKNLQGKLTKYNDYNNDEPVELGDED